MSNGKFKLKTTIPLTDEFNKSNVDQQKIDSETVTCMIAIPDLELVVTGNQSGILKFWKFGETFQIENIMDDPKVHGDKILAMCYFNDGKSFFSGGCDSTLGFVNLDNPKWEFDTYNKYPENQVTRKTDLITGDITSICNSFDGKHLFYNIGSKITVFDVMDKKITNIMEFQLEIIYSMLYMEKSKQLLYTTDKSIKMIDPFDSSVNFSLSLDVTIYNLISCYSSLQSKFFIIGSSK